MTNKLNLKEHRLLAYLLERHRLDCVEHNSTLKTKKAMRESNYTKIYKIIDDLKYHLDYQCWKDFDIEDDVYYGSIEKINRNQNI